MLQHLLRHDEPERQAAKDRAQADSDDQVNLKAEMEIMALHDKLDAIDLALEPVFAIATFDSGFAAKHGIDQALAFATVADHGDGVIPLASGHAHVAGLIRGQFVALAVHGHRGRPILVAGDLHPIIALAGIHHGAGADLALNVQTDFLAHGGFAFQSRPATGRLGQTVADDAIGAIKADVGQFESARVDLDAPAGQLQVAGIDLDVVLAFQLGPAASGLGSAIADDAGRLAARVLSGLVDLEALHHVVGEAIGGAIVAAHAVIDPIDDVVCEAVGGTIVERARAREYPSTMTDGKVVFLMVAAGCAHCALHHPDR